MLELSSAWNAPLADLRAAGAFLRGEIDAATADAALTPVCRAHEPVWSLALAISEALERDVVDSALMARFDAEGGLAIHWLQRVSGLSIPQLKHALVELRELGDELYEPGALSRVLARARVGTP